MIKTYTYKKILPVICAFALLSSLIIPISSLYSKAEEAPGTFTKEMLLPNGTATYRNYMNGWFRANVTYNYTDDGVRITYKLAGKNVEQKHCHQLKNTVDLDGLVFSMKAYSGYGFYVAVSNTNKMENINNSLALKLTPSDTNGQLFVNLNGVELSDISGFSEQSTAYPNRVNSSKLFNKTDYKIKFFLTEDGGLKVDINGVTGTVSASQLSTVTGLTDLSNVYLYVVPLGYAGDQTILDYEWNDCNNIYKQQAEPVIKLITQIGKVTSGSVGSITAARTAYDALHNTAKKYVTNYDVLQSAEYTLSNIDTLQYTDEFHYGIRAEDIYPTKSIMESWGNWPVTVSTATDGSLGISYDEKLPSAYTIALKAISADNLHAKLSVIKGETFWISFAYRQTSPSNAHAISFLLNSADKTIGVYYGGVTEAIEYKSFDNVTEISDLSALDIKMIKTDEDEYKIIFNNTFSYTIDNKLLALGNDMKNAITGGTLWLNISPNGQKLSVNIKSIHSGNQACYDELLGKYGKEALALLTTAVSKINKIGSPITAQSGLAIMEAQTAYDALPMELKKYVSNFIDLQTAQHLYSRFSNDTINLDNVVYMLDVSNVGPKQNWDETLVKWQKAQSGVGVTIEFNNTTIHNLGLNANQKLPLDGMHIQFANTEMTGNGGKFSLIFADYCQCDLSSTSKCLWINFDVSEDGMSATVGAPGQSDLSIIKSSYLNQEFLAGEWDVRFNYQETDGSYLFTVGGIASGKIPAGYINSAVSNGLDLSSVAVTFSTNNYSQNPLHLKTDVLSIHSGNTECYCNVAKSDYEAVKNCIELINHIGVINVSSGARVTEASSAFNALGTYLQGLVSNSQTLVTAIMDYNSITSDAHLASSVISLIYALPNKDSVDIYTGLIKAYGAYLDLYPRARAFVTNAKTLLDAVKTYETKHVGVNLKNETINEYTGGKNAYYLTQGNSIVPDMIPKDTVTYVQTGENNDFIWMIIAAAAVSFICCMVAMRKLNCI